MGMIVALQHTTSYQYDRLISLGPQVVRLKPAPHCRTPVHSYSLKITPNKHFLNWQQDPFGNYLARAVFPEKVKQLHVEVGLTAEIRVFNPFDFFLEDSAKHFPFSYDTALKAELTPYLEIKEAGPLLKKFVNSIKINREAPSIDFLIDINQRLEKELSYLIRMEPGVQTCEQTLSLKSGSCRDMAWLLCQVLRHLGLATRFCSGYLIQLIADVKSLDGPSGTTEDFTDLHAWTEVFLPGAGWVGFDPTSGLLTGEGHLPLCCTPNPSSAAPISGALDPCEATMEHHMKVTRIHEDPRITKPYSEQQWRAIDQLGRQIDQDLMNQDVRLTMGGEPTFVSIDDRESSEWQLEALGPQKKALSQTLFKRLQGIYGKHGLVHHGQGKWYPGEILPRWSMNCYWRKDGQAMWQDASLMSGEAADKAQTHKDALRFASHWPSTWPCPQRGFCLHMKTHLTTFGRKASFPSKGIF
ncbi:Transglutaminase-like superfamily protein [Pseudobacteriovorax antillogorgiicola]|uniref:Transglutaminase-like superfamily protein n=1 Tax=Pseudobacteriovorax antillogorgiicola TaxID=1513793 RepID=A0A1Y6BWN8_9BACT|nr:transglutaminase superfamily protein [Pseudobacteriovorax antillogorgiicola]SMF24882.1 Transglutaminase-like superfamily protein [Pseudobacteriovorax antillogorgiicola]